MSYELRSARWIAADVLRQVVQPGDTVVDATLGNGHDTLMLCELVGETGRVIGFDIQPDAVERTRERLADAGMLSRCTLYAEGHEHLSERVTVPIRTATLILAGCRAATSASRRTGRRRARRFRRLCRC